MGRGRGCEGGSLSTLNLPSKTPPVSGGQCEKILEREIMIKILLVHLYTLQKIEEHYPVSCCFLMIFLWAAD